LLLGRDNLEHKEDEACQKQHGDSTNRARGEGERERETDKSAYISSATQAKASVGGRLSSFESVNVSSIIFQLVPHITMNFGK
jgi:hypothetical protein